MLASRKDLWFHDFLAFLGITDERVVSVCLNDHAVALETNLRDFNNLTASGGGTSGTGGDDLSPNGK